ncbi:lasso peptide biosynthesis PqqD family chaperone [Streptomyces uncialis]|uniref:lasso peptide biosynthesis PqqD family chaperone n=1 Tax=Streptomyces uncialis TaxID=1048205 RepID=UPI003826FA15
MSLTLRTDVTATDTDGGMVLLDQRGGRYWQLNPAGATVLRLLLDGRSPQEVAERLARDSSVAAERALSDVRTLVDALSEARLVVAS